MGSRVLIVDDDLVVAEDLAQSLKEMGYEIAGIVSSGEDALQKTQETQPGLVLMDIKLKGSLDGIEAANRIRSDLSVPVVFITAYAATDIVERAKKTQPYGFLGKPVSLVELRAVIETALFKHDMEQRLRQSEARYRNLFEYSADAILISDLEGTLLDANQAAVNLFGYDRDELIGIDIRSIYADPDHREIFKKKVRENGFIKEHELPLRKRDGTVITCLATTTVRRNHDGDVIGYYGIVRDITERKRAEELQLQAARSRAVADLASGVAHSFNNLLQIVMGSAGLALSAAETGQFSEIKDNLQQIIECSKFGAQTVKRLNTIAGFQNDSTASEPFVFDMSDVVSQAVEMSKPWWKAEPERNGIRISLQVKVEPRCLIKGRKNEMIEVVINLVRNAVEALPRGGNVEIATSVEEDWVIVRIRDNGMGIPEKHRGRVFTPFFTTSLQTGKGLGLAISHSIVNDHGGTVFVDSEQGQGTCVEVRLPLAKDTAPHRPVPKGSAVVKPLTVLVIDDLPITVQLLKEALETQAHTVLTAESGEQGLEILTNTPVDLVICDLGMPGMNGLQVAKNVKDMCERKGCPSLPFILLTGWGDQSRETANISELGVDEIVEKPVDICSLLTIVTEVVQRKGSSRQATDEK